MRRTPVAFAALCLVSTAALGQTWDVTDVGNGNALSTVAQRHMLRMDPPGGSPVYLLAVQRDAYWWPDPEGLHWYRSDDGVHWGYYRPIFDDGIQDSELHLTTDVVARGNDIALVYSYDMTDTGFPSDPQDPQRKVYFQWWRYDGAGNWQPQPLVTVASPAPDFGYHRAELAFDSLGRIWVQAWYRDPCFVTKASPNCSDTAQIYVSTDAGKTFQKQPDLVRQPILGGGRLISLGERMMFLWGDYSWDNPAQYLIRSDSAALNQWTGPFVAFPDRDSIYHGAALNAVADGRGGLHLVFKDRFQNLYYRFFDGSAFGEKQMVDVFEQGDWAMQPAITRQGDELYVCTNHTVVPGTYELRSRRLSDNFSTFTLLNGVTDEKLYPTAPETVPPEATSLPCAYTVGWWPGHLRVAVESVVPQLPRDFTVTATPTSFAGAGSVTVDLKSSGGYAGTVSLSVAGQPSGASATFSPAQVPVGASGGRATLVLDPGTAAGGSYGLTVSAKDGTRTRTTLVIWNIQGVPDAGPGDAGPADAGPSDAGAMDAGAADAGPPDAGPPDAGPPDAGPADAGVPDAGAPDAGGVDAGPTDAGVQDVGSPDAGPVDAGPPDAGAPDAGPPDAGPPDAGAPSPTDVSGLLDPFTGPGVSPSLWDVYLDTAGSAANATAGELTMSLDSNARAGVHIASRGSRSLVSSSVHIHVASVFNNGVQASQRFKLAPDVFGEQHVGFWYELGTVECTWSAGDQNLSAGSFTYSPTNTGWWRIREEGGTVFWETAPDGKTWQVRGSLSTSSLGFSPSSLYLMFEVKAWSPNPNAGTAKFRDLNR